MAKQVTLGLNFDISAFRKGTNDAAKLVKTGLNANTLNGFNTGIQRTGSSIKRNITSNLASVKTVLGGLKGVIAGVVAAIGINRVYQFLKSAVEESRKFANEMQRVAGAALTFGTNLSPARIKEFARQMSLYSGQSMTSVFGAQAPFAQIGATPEQQESLTRLALDVAAGTGDSLDAAVEFVRNARLGKGDVLEKLNIAPSGDAKTDAAAALERLNELYGGLAMQIANPVDKLTAAITNLKAMIGAVLTGKLDATIQDITDSVNGYVGTLKFEQDMQTIVSALEGLGWLIDKITAPIREKYQQITTGVNAANALGATATTAALGKGSAIAKGFGLDGLSTALMVGQVAANVYKKGAMDDVARSVAINYGADGDITAKGRAEREAAEGAAKKDVAGFNVNKLLEGVDFKVEEDAGSETGAGRGAAASAGSAQGYNWAGAIGAFHNAALYGPTPRDRDQYLSRSVYLRRKYEGTKTQQIFFQLKSLSPERFAKG